MNILKLSPEKFEEIVGETVAVLKKGGVVAIPTDTIYGLAADAKNPEAVRKIFEIKQRPEEKALPIFVSSVEEVEKLAEIDTRQRKFLASAWPGKVTCVLLVRSSASNTIAFRIPKHDFVLGLLKAFGGPLAQTSVNISGEPPLTKIEEIILKCATSDVAQPDIIVNAGDLAESAPSTVVDLTTWPPKILRPGAVSEEELQKIVNML